MIPFLLKATINEDIRNAILVSSTNPKEKLYTTKEVSEILGVTEYTVRKKIRDGELPAKTFPGHAGYRIKQEALRDYINLHSIHNPAKLSQDELSQPIPEIFTATMQSLTEVLNNNSRVQTDPAVIQTFIDGKKIDLNGLNLRLRLLELNEDATDDFQRKKISLELTINQLQAEIKACELFKLALEKTSGEATS